MSSIKCPHCGLANFTSAVTCKRCNNILASAPGQSTNYGDGAFAPSSAELTPPRTLGSLLTVLGSVLALAGVYLLTLGSSPYFLVAGIGIAASGALIAYGKLAGVYLYFSTFAIMVVWSLIETKGEPGKLLPRIAVPALIGLHLLTEKVRARLK